MAVDMVQVTVAGMILDQQTRGPVLLLHIPPLDKYLPVWIGPSEAASISMALKEEQFERPLTHDLLVTIIDGLEGKVTKVVINALHENTFFAKIFIERGQQVIGIDARPSDSVAIAIRTGSPIFIAEGVLDREQDHLLSLDEETTNQMLSRNKGVPGLVNDVDPLVEPGTAVAPDTPAEPDDAAAAPDDAAAEPGGKSGKTEADQDAADSEEERDTPDRPDAEGDDRQ